MGLFDTKLPAPRVVFGKRNAESIKSGTDDRVFEKYAYCDGPEMKTPGREISTGTGVSDADPAKQRVVAANK